MLKLIPPLGVVLGSARMDFQKWFHKGVAPALSVCVILLFNTLRRLYIHRILGLGLVLDLATAVGIPSTGAHP